MICNKNVNCMFTLRIPEAFRWDKYLNKKKTIYRKLSNCKSNYSGSRRVEDRNESWKSAWIFNMLLALIRKRDWMWKLHFEKYTQLDLTVFYFFVISFDIRQNDGPNKLKAWFHGCTYSAHDVAIVCGYFLFCTFNLKHHSLTSNIKIILR